jgi:cytochrome c-type biogenesis protein CcmH
MLLWGVVALMTVAAMGAVVWPFRRRTNSAPGSAANDVAVYRDQLAEIDRDKASGLIDGPEADAARIEVSRRLLAAADRAQTSARAAREGEGSRRRRLAAAGALVALPVGAVALYLAIGSPGLQGESFDARIAAAHGDRSVEAVFARVEEHLASHPEDGRGWEVIAPIYMDLGRYADAVKARGNALRLLGTTAERQAFYGEALTAAANGVVTAEAKAAFDQAIDLDRSDPTARFYQGLAAEQDGSAEDAKRIWRALLADAPEAAQWAAFVRQALARVESPDAPGAAALATGGDKTAAPAGQDDVIRGMVERLAARLRADGSDADGWIRLVRSYKVLGDRTSMDAVIADARRALTGDAPKLASFEDGLNALGSEPVEAAQAPPPSRSTAAAPAASAPDQDKMIRDMVERLAARLRRDGSDVDGWIMLVRSHLVLGEPEQARAAVADARRALTNDPDKLRRFDEGTKSVGAAASSAPAAAASAAGPGAAPSPAATPMIRGMVEGLAERLHRDGSDVDGWIRLVRSYLVLGEAEQARTAAIDARRALATKTDDLRRLEEGLQGLKSLGFAG